jgi:AhpD family alkylhydroperoxidase
VTELIALGAAVAANCETCFKFHYGEARKLGVSVQDLLQAAETGLQVQQAPHDAMLALARKLLLGETAAAPGGGCCPGGNCG